MFFKFWIATINPEYYPEMKPGQIKKMLKCYSPGSHSEEIASVYSIIFPFFVMINNFLTFLTFDAIQKKMKYIIMLLSVIFLVSCQEEKQGITAEEIINKTIEKAGGDRYTRAVIEFKFRDHIYKSTRNRGEFSLERIKTDTIGTIKDVVSNIGFQRYLNDSLVKVPDSMAVRYESSVNSVHYFAHLPYGLKDKAVNYRLAGEAEIKGEPYYQLKITFQQEGGGVDHHDEFMYWIHKNNFTVDYLAYKFLVNDGGIRFREAFNIREIEGIRFADYKNYSIDDFHTPLNELDELYEAGELELLSVIETEVISVEVKD